MRVLYLADIDNIHWQNGPSETHLIIALGDVADSVIMEAWEANAAPPVFAVKGNHDASAPFPEGITDLHLKTVKLHGVTFGGFNGSWQYKPRGHFLYKQDEVTNLLKDFPRVDVFIAHNSPMHLHAKDDGIHCGFEAFDQYIAEKQPRLFIHGHQHINRETVIGTTTVIGVYGHRISEIAGPTLPDSKDYDPVAPIDKEWEKRNWRDVTPKTLGAAVQIVGGVRPPPADAKPTTDPIRKPTGFGKPR